MDEGTRLRLSKLRLRFEGWSDEEIMLELSERLATARADNSRLKRIAKEAIETVKQTNARLDRDIESLKRFEGLLKQPGGQ